MFKEASRLTDKMPKVPSPSDEAEMFRLLKQDAKRKEYMSSPAAKAKRKQYQEKKRVGTKALREQLKADPDLLEQYIAKDPSLAILRPKS